MRALALALGLLCAPALAHAQGVGIFVRASCSVINNPVVGATQCWDSTYNQLRSWNGVSWVAVGFAPVPVGTGTTATLTIDPVGRVTLPGALIAGGGYTIGTVPVIVASTSNANLTNIAGLSSTATSARNLRGTCTFAAAATCAVAFTTNEPDANYFLALGCQATSAANVHPVSWDSKAVSGFTLRASVSNSNACDWHLTR